MLSPCMQCLPLHQVITVHAPYPPHLARSLQLTDPLLSGLGRLRRLCTQRIDGLLQGINLRKDSEFQDGNIAQLNACQINAALVT